MSVRFPWMPEPIASPIRRLRDRALLLPSRIASSAATWRPAFSIRAPQIGALVKIETLKKYGALRAVRPLNAMIRRTAAVTHRWQHVMEWHSTPNPEWYDTHLGQFYRWRADRVSWIWDRGVFSAFAMKPNARVLDLCCGGGFFTYHFYAGRAAHVVGADFDKSALSHARKYNQSPNIEYVDCDIRQGIPAGPFDNVVWDGAIEHFTPAEIDTTIISIKKQMSPGALLSGYTIKEDSTIGLQNSHHEYEFSSKEDLARFFTGHFKNVLTFETIYPERHNLHFFASDAPLPFDADWKQSFRSS